jgi:hypothetical protein
VRRSFVIPGFLTRELMRSGLTPAWVCGRGNSMQTPADGALPRIQKVLLHKQVHGNVTPSSVIECSSRTVGLFQNRVASESLLRTRAHSRSLTH